MSKEIKPKKERKFLKALGKIGEVLIQELFFRVGSNLIRKIGGKKPLPSILFIFLSLSLFAQFPNTLNKQRLGFQTTGDGLTWRGSISDTASIQPINNQNAWVILDTINLKFYSFDFTSNVWNLVGGAAFTQPVDSLFFNVNVPTNNVDTAKMRWDSDLGTVVLGMYDNVPNELGFKNFWLVKNQTGSTITKGSLVYANGTVGSSGRITVAKFIANGSIDAKYLLGITAHDLTDGEDGYVISYGKIRQVNTDTFAAGAILYPSPTVAGVWTDVEPIAPNIDMPIGFCINSHVNNGTIAIRVASGYKLSELHDVSITSPVDKASLYYSGGLWRDTTATLLVSDTAAMLANYTLKGYVDSIAQNFQDSIDEINNGYFKQEFPNVLKDTLNWTKPVQLPIGGSNLLLVFRNGQMINDAQYSVIDTNKVKINTGSFKLGENYTVVYVKGGGGSGGGGTTFDTSVLNLQARLDLKLNIADTAAMLANYATKEYADTTGRLYARQDFTNVPTSTLTWTQSDTLIPGGVTFIQVYRNGQILLPSQYTIPTSTSVVIAASSFKVNDNYTVIFPRGGGAESGGGSGSLTSISGGTGIIVSPDPITTTGTVSADLNVLMELTDTSLLNLTSRFNTKQNTLVSGTNIKTVNSNSLLGSGNISVGTLVAADTVSLSNRINTKLNTADTASLSNRINLKLNAADTASLSNRINLKLNTTDTASLSNRINLKLNAADTVSLSNRINEKGTGTVQNIATGYGITGGAITTTGTLLLDSAVVFSRIRDSIVDVAIGTDTIKILKQEYAPATTSVLTWTVTSKFPIQLKAYILVFRNGQLLINDQYNLTDTNKITIVSNSFKVGANYTVVTVSGIGSVGTGVFPNPVYPEAGIAVSTGSAWASSVPNNSANWNIAFNDKINNAEFTGTTTKTLTLTQYDGGTFAPTFTDLQGIVAADTASMLTSYLRKADTSLLNLTSRFAAKLNLSDTLNMLAPYLRKADTSLLNLTSRFQTKLNISDTSSMLTNYLRSGTAASTYQTILTNPVTGTGTTNTLPLFTGASTLGNSVIQQSSNNIGINTTPFASLTLGQGKNIMLDASSNNIPRILFYETNGRNENDVQFGAKIQYNSPSDRLEFVMRDSFSADPSGDELAMSMVRQTGNTTIHKDLAVTGNITEGGNNVLTNLDTVSLSTRINAKLNINDTASMLNPYWRADKFSGTLPIANGGTGAESASVARTTLGVGYTFYSTTTGATVVFSSNRVSLVITGTGSTTTIDLTTATNGRQYMIKNLSNATVISSASNVIPLAGGSAGTAILSAGNVTPQWVTLVADGTNWHVMQSN